MNNSEKKDILGYTPIFIIVWFVLVLGGVSFAFVIEKIGVGTAYVCILTIVMAICYKLYSDDIKST